MTYFYWITALSFAILLAASIESVLSSKEDD